MYNYNNIIIFKTFEILSVTRNVRFYDYMFNICCLHDLEQKDCFDHHNNSKFLIGNAA